MTDHPDALAPVDRLSSLLERFRVRAHLFHAGPLCGVTHYAPRGSLGFLHVMQRGEMVVTHRARAGAPKRIEVREPSLLFYPRPLAHDFHNAPAPDSDFTCATVSFDGGSDHPLARALPPVIVLPLARVDGLSHTLALLFGEMARVQAGQRLLANRLMEVLLLQVMRWLLDHPQEGGVPAGLLTGLSHPGLSRMLVAVHERPGEAWPLEAMAREAGLSRSVFAATFKSHMGTSPAEYLAQWRLSIAQSELVRGESVKVLAAQLGYGSATALSRVFAQKVGQSPRDWLRNQAVTKP